MGKSTLPLSGLPKNLLLRLKETENEGGVFRKVSEESVRRYFEATEPEPQGDGNAVFIDGMSEEEAEQAQHDEITGWKGWRKKLAKIIEGE